MINCNITMIKLLTWCSGMGSYLACKIYIFNIFVRIPIYIYICSRQIFFSALHVVSHILHSTYRFRFFTELYYFTWSLLSVQNLFSLPLLLSCVFFLNSSLCFLLLLLSLSAGLTLSRKMGIWPVVGDQVAGLSHLSCHACSLVVWGQSDLLYTGSCK